MHTRLNNQHQLLQIRELGLSPQIFDGLQALDDSVKRLEQQLQDDDTELGQLRALTETAALINSSLDVDSVLGQAMDELIRLTNAERGFILLLNEESEELEFRISREVEQTEAMAAGNEVSRTILNEVITTGIPLLTDNASNDPRMQKSETLAKYVLRSVVCAPLIYKERAIGAIYVDNRYREGVFTERELNLLQAFANQTAIALENAILFARVQATLREITETKELMENVFASIGSGVITTDAEDRVVTYNPAAAAMLRRPASEALNKPVQSLMPRMGAAELENKLHAVQQGGEQATIELQSDVPGRGRVALNVKISPLRDADQMAQGVAMVVDDLTDQREGDETLQLMNRYLPPGLSENIQQIAGLALGGERREVTCVFIHVCPYSVFPPDARPQQIMELLNEYLQVATDVIHDARGVIDKYMGNEIMVLFNTQLNPQEKHGLLAVDMALALRTAFVDLYQRLGIAPDPHYYRFGIHSGVATLGNVGSLNRRSFTALGDSINLSHRLLENAQRGQIIISDDVYQHICRTCPEPPPVAFTERDPIKVKGREQLTRIFEVFRQ
ncbi:MAG: GAF domain-containing protein [Chloroflexi bacterium]|nr:GAF domain-containing protein [Chloroflexota bacterium]